MKPLVIITGPTAVGKTDISIDIAGKINGEIISADSVQVFKYMDIGSAKIKSEEMQGIKHMLIDELYPDEDFNIYEFKKRSEAYINQIYEDGKIPIIVGGTAFYIQALIYDVDFSEEDKSNSIRDKYNALADKHGVEYVHNLLREVDPESADKIHPNNLKRVIRALEYYEINGEKISLHNEVQSKKESPYNFVYFVLNRNRDDIYKRIDMRVDEMIKEGLVDEVKKLLDMGYSRDLNSMGSIGYKEIVSYLHNETNLDEAIDEIKKNTRHFAKRQLTWFRRERDVEIVDYEQFNNDKQKIEDYMIDIMRKKSII